MLGLFLIPLLVLLQGSPLRVEGPDPATVVLGETSLLRIQIKGSAKGRIPSPPVVPGLSIQTSGPSIEQRFQSFNGRTVANETLSTWTLSLKPKKVGTFEIPSFRIVVGNKAYTVPSRTLRCVPNKQAQADTYLAVLGPGRSVYKGEIFSIRLRFGVRRSLFRKLNNPWEGQGIDLPIHLVVEWPELLPIQGEDTGRTRQGEHSFVLGDGKENRAAVARQIEVPPGLDPDFYVFEYQGRWVAKHSGKLELDPPSMMIQWIRGYTRDIFFQKPVLGRIERVGDPLLLEVRELPSVGRPASFTNAVGEFRVQGRLSRTRFPLGAPIEFRLRVEGEGNLPFLELPELDQLQGFNRFSKKVKRDARGVTGIYEVAAIDHGIKSFPSIEFSYFDPKEGRFKSLRTEAIPVEVSGKRAKSLTALEGTEAGLPEVEEDIRDFMELGDDGAAGPPSWLAWSVVGLPLVAFFLLLLFRRNRERERRDPTRRRAREARRRFDQNLESEGPLRAFSLYLADRFGWDEGAALDPKLDQRLAALGVGEELRSKTLALMAELQASRYGGGGTEEERASRARSLVQEYESFKPSKTPALRGAEAKR